MKRKIDTKYEQDVENNKSRVFHNLSIPLNHKNVNMEKDNLIKGAKLVWANT